MQFWNSRHLKNVGKQNIKNVPNALKVQEVFFINSAVTTYSTGSTVRMQLFYFIPMQGWTKLRWSIVKRLFIENLVSLCSFRVHFLIRPFFWDCYRRLSLWPGIVFLSNFLSQCQGKPLFKIILLSGTWSGFKLERYYSKVLWIYKYLMWVPEWCIKLVKCFDLFSMLNANFKDYLGTLCLADLAIPTFRQN